MSQFFLNQSLKQEGDETVYTDWDSPQVEFVADIGQGEVGPGSAVEKEWVGLHKGDRARVLRQSGGRQ